MRALRVMVMRVIRAVRVIEGIRSVSGVIRVIKVLREMWCLPSDVFFLPPTHLFSVACCTHTRAEKGQ
jgi:hypothetical protein